MAALLSRNYAEVVRYSSELAENIDNTDTGLREAIVFNYAKLLVSYKYLGRRGDYEKLKEKAINLFPDEKETFERIWK